MTSMRAVAGYLLGGIVPVEDGAFLVDEIDALVETVEELAVKPVSQQASRTIFHRFTRRDPRQ